jgi:hypothetical protein
LTGVLGSEINALLTLLAELIIDRHKEDVMKTRVARFLLLTFAAAEMLGGKIQSSVLSSILELHAV